VSTPSSQGRLALAADVVAAPVTGQAFGERGRVGGCCFCTPRSLCSGERRLRLRYAKLDAVSGSYAFRFTWLTELPAGALAATHRGGDKNARRLKLSRPWRRDATRSYVPARPPVSVSVPRGVVVYSPAPPVIERIVDKRCDAACNCNQSPFRFHFHRNKGKRKVCVCVLLHYWLLHLLPPRSDPDPFLVVVLFGSSLHPHNVSSPPFPVRQFLFSVMLFDRLSPVTRRCGRSLIHRRSASISLLEATQALTTPMILPAMCRSHPFFSLSGEGRRVEARRRASGIPSDATGLRARRRSSYGRVELPVPPRTGDHAQPPPLRHDRRRRGSAGGADEPPEATAATPAGHQPRRAASACTRARRPSRRPRPFSWNRLFSGSVSRSTRGQERSE
jgi:hypothetical protein